jgi:hypothetical protein
MPGRIDCWPTRLAILICLNLILKSVAAREPTPDRFMQLCFLVRSGQLLASGLIEQNEP